MRLLGLVLGTLTLFMATQAFAMGQHLPSDGSGGGSGSGSGSGGSSGGSSTSILQKYSYVDPGKVVPRAALQKILSYYDSHKSSLGNSYYISVLDFNLHSSKKRLHVIDMKSGKVSSYLAAHGIGSEGSNDDGYATVFSNTPGSNASSLGLYKTGSLYDSSNHGTAMYLYGLESTNSNAYDRAIVMHGAWYVSPSVISESGRIGRSQGCPAVEDRYISGLVATLKSGSLLLLWK